MLVVKTFLSRDSRGGTGLFAGEYIKAGSLIWQYNEVVDQFYTVSQYFALCDEARRIVSHHGYRATVNGVHGILLSHDNDRFVNHSLSADIECRYEEVNPVDSRFAIITAGRDIDAGIEITANYFDFDLPGVPADAYSGIPTCSEFLREEKSHSQMTIASAGKEAMVTRFA